MSIVTLLIGLTAGTMAGLFGIGGGLIIIPAFFFILGFDQHMSQGTSLAAMIPPIGLFAALTYYKEGFVDVPTAALVAAGFLIGGFFGAKMAVEINAELLRKMFGFFFLIISIKMIIGK